MRGEQRAERSNGGTLFPCKAAAAAAAATAAAATATATAARAAEFAARRLQKKEEKYTFLKFSGASTFAPIRCFWKFFEVLGIILKSCEFLDFGK